MEREGAMIYLCCRLTNIILVYSVLGILLVLLTKEAALGSLSFLQLEVGGRRMKKIGFVQRYPVVRLVVANVQFCTREGRTMDLPTQMKKLTQKISTKRR